jgi:hypothetical protein
LDWKFRTVPQSGLGGREAPWARGKVVGGSSALNYMTWNRASKTDYDEWRELGNHGWGWDDLLFVFCFVLCPCNPLPFFPRLLFLDTTPTPLSIAAVLASKQLKDPNLQALLQEKRDISPSISRKQESLATYLA